MSDAPTDDPESPVRRAIADAVPDRELEPLADWSSREPNAVWLLAAGDEQLVCKVARDGDAGRIAREAAATAHAHRRTGLAPEVVAHGGGAGGPVTTGGSAGSGSARSGSDGSGGSDAVPPYLLTRRLPGSPPAENWGDLAPDTDPDRFRRLGAALAALHEGTRRGDCGPIRGVPDGVGVADGSDGTGRGSGDAADLDLAGPGSWHGTLLEVTGRRVTDLDGTRFEALGREALSCLGRHPELERGARPALVHNDPGPYNALFSGGAVRGLVDWELAFCGDAVYDPVWVETAVLEGPADLADPEAAVDALWDGYRERIPRRENFAVRRAAYRLVRSLRPLRTFDSWGPAVAADRPGVTVEDLADRARASVRDRIDALDAGGSDREATDATGSGAGGSG